MRINLQRKRSSCMSQIGLHCFNVVTCLQRSNRNPKMEILYPLIRLLHIDPSDIFYPEAPNASPALQELRLLIEDCSDQEAAALIPVFRSVLTVLRSKDAMTIKQK